MVVGVIVENICIYKKQKYKTMDDSDSRLHFAEFCFDHFEYNDNAKNDQYRTPLGSKGNSPNDNESESIEIVETPDMYHGPLQESTISSASTNNTDICVLESHYANDDIQLLPLNVGEVRSQEHNDEFVESDDGDDVFVRAINVLDKHEDFTVLLKPSTSYRHCDCEESTEVLMLINSECQEKRKIIYSGTDSDVEVLMSDEILDSDWSSSNAVDVNAKENTLVRNSANVLKFNKSSEEVSSPSCMQQSFDCNSFKTQASTDLDASGDELNNAGIDIDKYHNLDRTKLLEVIHKQELCIQALEDTVQRYQEAQQRLFEHVDALRSELSEFCITPFKMSSDPEKCNLSKA